MRRHLAPLFARCGCVDEAQAVVAGAIASLIGLLVRVGTAGGLGLAIAAFVISAAIHNRYAQTNIVLSRLGPPDVPDSLA